MHSIEQIREAFEYHPQTGQIIRRSSGKNASYPVKTGYCRVFLGATKYKAHRLIWALVYGEWPICIDHEDGNRANNRISNLRNVCARENSLNQRLRSNNKSGCSGVNWKTKVQKWQSQIRDNGEYVYLGCFDSLFDAIASRKSAELRLGYHENHGALRARYERD